ncbi:hypothetical protein AYO43_03140 [Nitrospira sp. SCGC AG-212-E16]|nr:hypothetical protein AYO43_03140 [Nitrospira sp. SCGC AG-212-E16]
MNLDYRKASDKIRNLESKRNKSSVLKAEEDLCKRFGLTMWAYPDDPTVTFENADAIVPPKLPVYALGPSRVVIVEGKNLATRATDDGWLTLKVNLLRPLENTERIVAGVLRAHRRVFTVLSRRSRPDSDLKALQAWDHYSRNPKFSSVAQQLKRKTSTVKGQYVRGHVLVCGSKPTGSMKQRRVASIGDDPAGAFHSHFASCSRCQKADSADKFCSRWAAFIDQDQVSIREQLNPSN